jgi:hypothetical protein
VVVFFGLLFWTFFFSFGRFMCIIDGELESNRSVYTLLTVTTKSSVDNWSGRNHLRTMRRKDGPQFSFSLQRDQITYTLEGVRGHDVVCTGTHFAANGRGSRIV